MQVTGRYRRRLTHVVSASAFVIAATTVWAEDVPRTRHHQPASASQEQSCKAASQDAAPLEGLESVQIETSDITLYEQFFEAVLQVPVVQRADHPQADRLREYCYRGLLIVVRQDLRTSRPTGWVQINFIVSDVAAMQEEVERIYRRSSISQLTEADRSKIVRFRFKPDVMRGDRRVARFEVGGPEGFMIGFDQEK
jgi:hypothetical protein